MKIVKVVAESKPCYTLYHLLLDDGTEATSLTKYKIGDKVQAFYDHKWHTVKVKKIV